MPDRAAADVRLGDLADLNLPGAGHVISMRKALITLTGFTAFAQASGDHTQFAATPIFWFALGR